MTKKSLLFVSIVILAFLLAACTGNPAVQEPVSFLDYVPSTPDAVRDYPLETVSGKTALNYFKDEKIFSGWNVGNTLDSHSGGIGGETTWGNPRINQELMNGVKAAGFDIIRVPVTWMGDIGTAPDYRIRVNRLSRVAEVVEMAREAGLKVIINLHHDGATEGNGRDLGWLSIRRAGRNMDDFNQITSQYVRVWRQIAAYFQNYGDWLIFEAFNELHDGSWQFGTNINQFMTLSRWNQLFVDIVRSSGGNNESRYLLISAYCKDYRQALSGSFVMPSDTAQDKLILSFHYYDPHDFSIAIKNSSWGTPAEKERVDRDFAPFKTQYIDKNIPVIIGECGAALQLFPNDSAREAQARQSRQDYTQHVFSTAKKYGLVPIYWDNGATRGNGEKFGLLDRRTGQPNSEDSSALIRLMINAVR